MVDLFKATKDDLIKRANGTRFFSASFAEIGFSDKAASWQYVLCMSMIRYVLSDKGMDVEIFLCYHQRKLVFFIKEFPAMKYEFCIPIPYEYHERYEDMILSILDKVSPQGAAMMFVCNNPYKLRSFLYLCDEHDPGIGEIVENAGLSFDYEYDAADLMANMAQDGSLASATLLPEDLDLSLSFIRSLYEFPSKDILAARGIGTQPEIYRKKVFISYSHKDEALVHEIVKSMKSKGLYLWIDDVAIDVGDTILNAMLSGLKECDLIVAFLSKSYKESDFAKFEFISFWNEAIQKKKKLFPIRLDDVNVNEIFYGLSTIKYFDYHDNIDELISSIKNKLNKE